MVFNKQSLTRGITLAASILANEISKITSVGGVGGYPKEIPASITVGTATVTDIGASIGISSERTDEKRQAPEITLAFELGSGLFGKEGQKYEIKPKPGGKVLRFMFGEAKWISPKYTDFPPGKSFSKGVKDVVGDDEVANLPSCKGFLYWFA